MLVNHAREQINKQIQRKHDHFVVRYVSRKNKTERVNYKENH